MNEERKELFKLLVLSIFSTLFCLIATIFLSYLTISLIIKGNFFFLLTILIGFGFILAFNFSLLFLIDCWNGCFNGKDF